MKQVDTKNNFLQTTKVFLSIALVAILLVSGLGQLTGHASAGRQKDGLVDIHFYTETSYRGTTSPDKSPDPQYLKEKLNEIHGKKVGGETASSFATMTDAESGIALAGKPGSELGPLPTTGGNSLLGGTFLVVGIVLLGIAYLTYKKDSKLLNKNSAR